MRALAILALMLASAEAAAQGGGTKAPPPASPPGATSKQGATTKQSAGTKQDTKAAPAPQTKGAAGVAARRPALAVAPPEVAPPPRIPVIMREVYEYDAAGRRDPFVSLLTTSELRPTVADLRLVIVLFDESGRRPVAVMRDLVTNTQYRVTTGMTLGRMRVTAIKRRAVIFTIEEFGLNRQDSLVLGDTSKVRAR